MRGESCRHYLNTSSSGLLDGLDSFNVVRFGRRWKRKKKDKKQYANEDFLLQVQDAGCY
jgi:hypothetical protein